MAEYARFIIVALAKSKLGWFLRAFGSDGLEYEHDKKHKAQGAFEMQTFCCGSCGMACLCVLASVCIL